jgi:hypothetical protein
VLNIESVSKTAPKVVSASFSFSFAKKSIRWWPVGQLVQRLALYK